VPEWAKNVAFLGDAASLSSVNRVQPVRLSFAVGVNLLLYGLIGPFAAALIDCFGGGRRAEPAHDAVAAA
jgi:hypothetical protein